MSKLVKVKKTTQNKTLMGESACPVEMQEKTTAERFRAQRRKTKPKQKKTKPVFRSMDELPSVLSVKELQTFLGISRAGAYQLLHREDFPTLNIASRLLVTKDGLKKWIEQKSLKEPENEFLKK